MEGAKICPNLHTYLRGQISNGKNRMLLLSQHEATIHKIVLKTGTKTLFKGRKKSTLELGLDKLQFKGK